MLKTQQELMDELATLIRVLVVCSENVQDCRWRADNLDVYQMRRLVATRVSAEQAIQNKFRELLDKVDFSSDKEN